MDTRPTPVTNGKPGRVFQPGWVLLSVSLVMLALMALAQPGLLAG